jgi:hypothetical protein
MSSAGVAVGSMRVECAKGAACAVPAATPAARDAFDAGSVAITAPVAVVGIVVAFA